MKNAGIIIQYLYYEIYFNEILCSSNADEIPISTSSLIIVQAESSILIVSTSGAGGRALGTIELHVDDEGKNFPVEIDSLNIDFTTFATYEYITLLEAESE